tara:strand:- start:28284 stop:28598 length:315 start_codon:yes stop_codon:yes gene_type:complete
MEIALFVTIFALVGIIIFMLFYIRWLLKTLSNIDSTISELWVGITKFNSHLKVVHDTEMFYGDSTLQALIEHSQELSENIESIKGIFLPEEDIEYEDESQEKEE